MTGCFGFLRHTAMSKASKSNSRVAAPETTVMGIAAAIVDGLGGQAVIAFRHLGPGHRIGALSGTADQRRTLGHY